MRPGRHTTQLVGAQVQSQNGEEGGSGGGQFAVGTNQYDSQREGRESANPKSSV